MIELLRDNYSYWSISVLMVIGLYGMLLKNNLVKKLIGLTIFQNAIILLFIVAAYQRGGTVPILDPEIGADPAKYISPLPHTLMLTAIVVGVATVGVALALLIVIYRRFGTLEESVLLERMR